MANEHGRLRKVLKKLKQPQTGWLDVFPAVVGKADGTVSTDVPGEIWVRNILNGQEIKVHNSVAPNIGSTDAPLQVEVGRRVEQPGLWQVKNIRESFSAPAGSGLVPYHFAQHVYPAADSGLFPRKQIRELTVLVADATAFIVQVYGGVIRTPTGFAVVENQTIDLSGEIPVADYVYVNIETNNSGVLSLNAGTPFEDLPSASNIPIPALGYYRIATVLLFELMEELLDEYIYVPLAIEGGMSGATTGGHIIQDEGTPLTVRANLNFVGNGVTATDDAGNDATVVTVSKELSYLISEDLTEQITGSTDHFDLTWEALAKCTVYCNLRQQSADVVMDTDMLGFTLSFMPTTDDKLIVDYYVKDLETYLVYDEAGELVLDDSGDFVLSEA